MGARAGRLGLTNLHNGLLALAFSLVGAYVLRQRRGHPEGVLLLATGARARGDVLGASSRPLGATRGGRRGWACGRSRSASRWVTLAVLAFPDGRLPSPRWRPVVVGVVALALVCSALSLLWPVEYDSAGIAVAHPFASSTPAGVDAVWSALAHPAYAAFQVLWPVAIWARWRSASGWVRGQLAWLLLAAAGAALVLVRGLVGWGTPTPGLIAVTTVPVAAGLAVVHGRHAAAYAALTWMSRRGPEQDDLPTDLARAASEALGAPVVLWLGSAASLRPVGVWPPTPDDPAPLIELPPTSRRIDLDDDRVGALTVEPVRGDARRGADPRRPRRTGGARPPSPDARRAGRAGAAGRPPREPDPAGARGARG